MRPIFACYRSSAKIPFKLIGIAVVHHGYARVTEDIDVLVEEDAPAQLNALLAAHGFSRGDPRPRADAPPYPLKLIDDAHYVELEAEQPSNLRGLLADLHRDAKEELDL